MAVGMEKNPIFGLVCTTIGSPNDVMVMPSGSVGRFSGGIQDRDFPVLFKDDVTVVSLLGFLPFSRQGVLESRVPIAGRKG
jgi:hypothetical protein